MCPHLQRYCTPDIQNAVNIMYSYNIVILVKNKRFSADSLFRKGNAKLYLFSLWTAPGFSTH